jgi:hypothetical protein
MEPVTVQNGAPPSDASVAPATVTSTTTTTPPTPAPIDVGVLGVVQRLSGEEQLQLMKYEETIRLGCAAFFDVGRALARIREHELFKEGYSSFEAYYTGKWNFQHSKVYYLIATSQVFDNLVQAPELPRPEYESQLRPLIGLPPDRAQQAWASAAKKAKAREQSITARLVKAVVAELQLASNNRTRQLEVRRERLERRRQLTDGMGELLQLIMTKTDHETLLQKAALLDGHVRYFFPKQRRR